MFDIAQLLTFSLAAFVVIIAPGPIVTIVIANALRFGAGAGLATVAGGLLGLAPMIGAIAIGLDAAATHLSIVFEWIRILGAAYLIWLGVKMIRSGLRPNSSTDMVADVAPPGSGFLLQGFFVSISNPKSLLFFGAFLPQFIRPEAGDPALQAAVLGLLFLVIAGLSDSAYALGAGRMRGWLARYRRSVEVTSGLFMTAGGLWMALRGRI